ncbi:hypothetical protein TNCV_28051 [Trichonephila clavipes]|uniref:Uncharacterized protein n=1 Tax=Trichonephila clavipes TaxID=2585209 RepID=A0A8X7BME1_TRICX|nr:hypothetical protein TNCV_28051 [Trichonephila clavipes]
MCISSYTRWVFDGPSIRTCDTLATNSGSKPLGYHRHSSEDKEATRGLLATDHVILNHGQVTWTTPELAPPSPNYHTTPTGGRFSSRQI